MRKPKKEKRVTFSRSVKPETIKLLKRLAEHLDRSEGQTLDRAVQALAVAESFGSEHLNVKQVDAEKLNRLAASTLDGLTDEEKRLVTTRPSFELDPSVDVKKLRRELRRGLACPECGRKAPGHSLTCEVGNDAAEQYQSRLPHSTAEIVGLDKPPKRHMTIDATGINRDSKRGKATASNRGKK